MEASFSITARARAMAGSTQVCALAAAGACCLLLKAGERVGISNKRGGAARYGALYIAKLAKAA